MRRWQKRAVRTLTVVSVVVALGYGYRAYRYPYGWSHCCDKQLYFALERYSERHEGWFPKGEATPEASLSLMHWEEPESVNANLLRGKTVPEAAVRSRLERGERLTPETCGWHYVEGLRWDDDSRLALFWDKAGLGHNGERLRGGRRVCLLHGDSHFVPDDQWDQFLAEQEQLRAKLQRPR